MFTYAALLIANPDAPPALTREAHMWEKMDEGRLQLIQVKSFRRRMVGLLRIVGAIGRAH